MEELLDKIITRQDLTDAEAEGAMSKIISGELDTETIKRFLLALREKGESLVASGLRKLAGSRICGLFYDPADGGADFLLQRADGVIVPVEAGLGEKGDRQAAASMRRYGSKHGITVSDSGAFESAKGVIHIPLAMFSLG
jgi:predicted AAA+ superfamily ATPase